MRMKPTTGTQCPTLLPKGAKVLFCATNRRISIKNPIKDIAIYKVFKLGFLFSFFNKSELMPFLMSILIRLCNLRYQCLKTCPRWKLRFWCISLQHFLLRAECEHLIRQGILEHIVHWQTWILPDLLSRTKLERCMDIRTFKTSYDNILCPPGISCIFQCYCMAYFLSKRVSRYLYNVWIV